MMERRVKYTTLFGIIGGFGPKASSVFYDENIVEGRVKLFRAMVAGESASARFQNVQEISAAPWTEEEVEIVWKQTSGRDLLKDQDHPSVIIFSASSVCDRVGFALGLSKRDPLPETLDVVDRLISAGATHIAMVCNTAHFQAQEISDYIKQRNPATTFVNMLDLTFDYIFSKTDIDSPIEKIGVLATNGSLGAKIFENAPSLFAKKNNMYSGVEIVTPQNCEHGVQEHFIEAVASIKSGYTSVTSDSISFRNLVMLFAEIVNFYKHGVRVTLLGCTELPLVINSENLLFMKSKLKTAPVLEILQEFNITVEELDECIRGMRFANPSQILGDEVLRLALLSRVDY